MPSIKPQDYSAYAFSVSFFHVTAIGLFLFCIVSGTGLATDDFVHLTNGLSRSWHESLAPRAYLSVPVLHYTHALAYHAIGESLWAYDLLKALYLTFAAWALIRFFSLFFTPVRAFLGALIFLLSPLHDGATLWLTGQYLIVSLALFLLAYIAAYENRLWRATALAILGSFSSYGSPPLAAGLTLMLLFQRRWRAALTLALPNTAYILYYIYTSTILKAGTARLPGRFDFLALAKGYVVQLASFVDAGLGPSAWFKFGLAIGSLSLISIALATLLSVWIWRTGDRIDAPPRTWLLMSGTGVAMLSAFGIFALTGAYPQVAFNLGDRILVYGNLFLVATLLRFAGPRLLAGTAIITLAAFMGMGDHWKQWNNTVNQSISRIRQQPGLAAVVPNEHVLVRGLQYSPLGPMTHIDHFTANYVIRDVMAFARRGMPHVEPISFNRRLRLEANTLIDIKYGDSFPIGESILIYDAEADSLTRVMKSDIPAMIAALPPEIRHWTQLLGPGITRDTILWLMPSLKYAYP